METMQDLMWVKKNLKIYAGKRVKMKLKFIFILINLTWKRKLDNVFVMKAKTILLIVFQQQTLSNILHKKRR